jgi:hypothetical protein
MSDNFANQPMAAIRFWLPGWQLCLLFALSLVWAVWYSILRAFTLLANVWPGKSDSPIFDGWSIPMAIVLICIA